LISKTSAIVLNTAPFSNTSAIVTWLTEDHGRISTMIKGAYRPKSWFLGQFDLFYTCELVYYLRDLHRLPLARECCPLKTRIAFRNDWKAFALASYYALLVRHSCPVWAPHPDLFRLVSTALDDLAQHGPQPALLYWFELKLLDELGLAPRLTHCLRCNRPAIPEQLQHSFSFSRGGIVCAQCREKEHDPDLTAVAPNVLAALQAWQKSRRPQAPRSTRCPPRLLNAIHQLLGGFLRFHTDIPPDHRRTTRRILAA
jgi:DNA repair protein RecO (recombination protein O)